MINYYICVYLNIYIVYYVLRAQIVRQLERLHARQAKLRQATFKWTYVCGHNSVILGIFWRVFSFGIKSKIGVSAMWARQKLWALKPNQKVGHCFVF